MNEEYIQPGYDQAVIHVIEEAAESIVAACKILRFGRKSVNPLLPKEQQETNDDALSRELGDLLHAIDRLCDEKEKLDEEL